MQGNFLGWVQVFVQQSLMKQKIPLKGKATLILTTHKTMQENLNKAKASAYKFT